jgi:hypothetical protein
MQPLSWFRCVADFDNTVPEKSWNTIFRVLGSREAFYDQTRTPERRDGWGKA